MNARRYVVCGVVSVALHSLALSAQQPPRPQFAISDAHAGSRVAIQLVAAHVPPPEPIAEKSTDEKVEKVTEPKDRNSTPVEKRSVVEKPKIEKQVVDKPNLDKQIVKKPKTIEPKPVQKKISKPADNAKPIEKIKPIEKPKKQATDNKPIDTRTNAQMNQAKDSAPVIVERPQFKVRPSQPAYPRMAMRKGMQGNVLIEVWLDEGGKQIKQALVKSSGFDLLDSAAMSAVKKWRFQSHTVNGVALAHRVRIPVRFNLD
ncbi:ferric siderophore ABC transporter substrate-binding protein [Enterovibrio norvegicus FF-162]|uniref:energy transducer TonB n=1 Tax=Enterovibrio norvegicus TaxID=188144 RepID=UPI00047537B9|nr:energy transducer TonB [Enterovibrio norvegicus]OEE75308.1 ferric siderophore ABC transporter substrate-binding protein [Enterovibrio norvegicus FF-162]